MPVYALDKVKRSVSSQKIVDVEDLDGAVVRGIVKATNTAGSSELQITSTNAENTESTLNVPFVAPDEEHYPQLVEASEVGGSANVITLSPTPSVTGYNYGDAYVFQAKSNATNTVTINVSGQGAKNVRMGGSNGGSGIINAEYWYHIVYDGTRFIIVGMTLGTAALRNTGTASGNVPTLDSNGKLNSGTIPTIPVAQGGTGATSASDARDNLGLGSAATAETGTAVGDVPELGSGGKLAIARIPTGTSNGTVPLVGSNSKIPKSVIPTGTGNGDIPALDASGDIANTMLKGILEKLGAVSTPTPSSDKNYVWKVTSGGVVSLVEAVFRHYVTPGTYSFTLPAGVNALSVEVAGAGGGGGGGYVGRSHPGSFYSASADGGPGGFSRLAVGSTTVQANGGAGGERGLEEGRTIRNPVPRAGADGGDGGTDTEDNLFSQDGQNGDDGFKTTQTISGISDGATLSITVGAGGTGGAEASAGSAGLRRYGGVGGTGDNGWVTIKGVG